MQVQPYLFFGGRCEEAIEFYRKALGAEVVMLTRFKEAPEPQPGLPECFEEKVMHATLRIGETMVMASDGRCEGGAANVTDIPHIAAASASEIATLLRPSPTNANRSPCSVPKRSRIVRTSASA